MATIKKKMTDSYFKKWVLRNSFLGWAVQQDLPKILTSNGNSPLSLLEDMSPGALFRFRLSAWILQA